MSDGIKWAVQNGDLDLVIKLSSEQGFDVNAPIDRLDRSLVHCASDYGQSEVLAYLISKGAKFDSPDKHGIHPILAAIWEGHSACVELLLNKGANKSGSAPDGTSYLDSAGKEEIKALLR